MSIEINNPKTEESAAMVEALEIVAMIENLQDGSTTSISIGKFKTKCWCIVVKRNHVFQGSTLHAALTSAVAAKKREQG